MYRVSLCVLCVGLFVDMVGETFFSILADKFIKPEMEPGHGSPGHGSPGQRFWPGRVGSRVSVSDPVFDPILSFNVSVYRGVVSTK